MARTLVLERNHVLKPASGQTVTVGDLRDDPSTFDCVRMADPLERGAATVWLALLRVR